MADRNSLTAARLRELLHYDPLTGVFTWRTRRGGRSTVGTVAGSRRKDGRIAIIVDGLGYYAHRLAWLHVTGAWPEHGIDHKDTIPWHNWFSNLRDANRFVNMQNQRRAQSDNLTGYLGVTKTSGGRFKSRIWIDGKNQHIGVFDAPDVAHAAYVAAKRQQHDGNTL